MELKRLMENYEIGGIGDIKKATLRFHSYRIGTEVGKLTIYAEYDPSNPPKVFKGYPSGQALLIDLCNLALELRDKSEEECARILIRWNMENIHMSYLYGDDVMALEYNKDGPKEYWDTMVNVLECYHIYVADAVRQLERLYTDTMTVFAIRSLLAGDTAEAQRIYEDVRVPEKKNLMSAWYRAGTKGRGYVIEDYINQLPQLPMGLGYDLITRQVQLQPIVKSVIDAAYFGLARFIAVNANALEDYGGKTSIAFCQACGKAFIKNGNRQKYCASKQCQSVRNQLKSKESYYRKKRSDKGQK